VSVDVVAENTLAIHEKLEEMDERLKPHMERVEFLTTLLGEMVQALSGNPMFAAMIPPHLQQKIKSL
jgi:hypothetical protein